ncbi:MAG: class I SAM-dependent rRNA methyltransferase [Calditrichaeota bacterium]|nr:class I SAM-dependent rRNA methyltransferase [Calditrichota bacterium]
MQTLHLKSRKESRIRSGHLWAFAGEISENLKAFKSGDAVALCDARGSLLGRGYVNPNSLIAVRLLTVGNEQWDEGLFASKIKAANAYRNEVCKDREAKRIVYSESDGLPGLFVDQYADYLVVQSLTAGIERRLDEITAALLDELNPKGILLRCDGRFRKLEGLEGETRELFGNVPDEILFTEDGMKYISRPRQGQKTGFYLDQHFNRTLINDLVHKRRVLDLFCYTGSWGLSALKSGASESIMVDSSQQAIDWGMQDAVENGFAKSLFIKADVNEFLEDAASRNDKFGIVIIDPPGFIKSRKALSKGISAYRTLNRNAMKVVKGGGYLVSCSCSHLLSCEQHLALIGEAARKAGRRVKLVKTGGHSPDHPVLPGHPETEYLKCWVVRVE